MGSLHMQYKYKYICICIEYVKNPFNYRDIFIFILNCDICDKYEVCIYNTNTNIFVFVLNM